MSMGKCPECGSSNIGKSKGILHPDPVDYKCNDCGYDNLEQIFKDRVLDETRLEEVNDNFSNKSCEN